MSSPNTASVSWARGGPASWCVVTTRSRARELAHDLQPGPVAGRAAGVPAAGDGAGRAHARRPVGERLREPRLPDAGLARQEHQATLTGLRLLDGRRQSRKLLPAAEQGQLGG